MNNRLHNDGDFTIYKVEVYRDQDWQDWQALYHDGSPVPTVPVRYATKEDQRRGREREPFRSYTACGECWQTTGIEGLFDFSKAEELVNLLLEHNPNLLCRIVKQKISQHTSVVCTVKKVETSYDLVESDEEEYW